MFGRPAAAVEQGSGELEAELTGFFADHYDRLVRLAALVCHSSASVEDAVQAAMEQAWRRRDTLRDPALLRPWLDQIVVRESIRVNRRPWWSRIGRPDEAALANVADRPSGIDATWIALSLAFRRLPIEQRAVVALHLYAGHTAEETARIMGASLETTRSRLRLARRRLRTELAEDER
jgi:RNA polymerase sigma factor (sigma-70 family)